MKMPYLLLLLSFAVFATDETPPPVYLAPAQPAAMPAPPPAAPPKRSAADLEKLAAPIALFPDPLIAIPLPAAAYPVDVILAARLLADTNNLATLEEQPYPSVNSSVAE